MNKIEIKELTDDHAIIAGYGVVFGGLDLEGETFGKNTDLMLDLVPVKPVFYDHRWDIKHKLGKVIKEKIDDLGVWVEAEIERSRDYANEVLELIKDGRLGWSSGSAGHLVERLGKNITQWPVIEFSLTPTPAEPRTLGIQQIKSVFDVTESEVPSSLVSEGEGEGSDDKNQREVNNMEGELLEATPAGLTREEMLDILDARDEAKAKREKEEKERQEALEEARKEGLEEGRQESLEKINTWAERKGIPVWKEVSELGSGGDPEEGDTEGFLHYVKTGDRKALQEGTDSEGGYLVPVGVQNRIVEKLAEFSWIRAAGAEIIPYRGRELDIPAESTEPALPTVAAEEASFTTDSPTLGITQVTLHKFTKLIKVSEELLEDTDLIAPFLERRVAQAFGEAEGKYAATGSGSSQPEGVFVGGTAGLTFDSTANITADEIPELFYKLQNQYRARPSTAWLAHPDTEAYLRMIRDANAFAFPGGSVEGGSIARGGWNLESLYRRPVFNDDDCATMASGAKVLCIGDFSYYALVEHVGGMSFRRLEELYAANGQIGLRWYKRWGGAVTQAEAFQYGTMA